MQEIGFLFYTLPCGAPETAYKGEPQMATYKYKHLTLDDRITIQKGLKDRLPFAEIAASIGKDPSTVSKEVRGHLIVKETGTRSRPFNPCMGRKICTLQRKA